MNKTTQSAGLTRLLSPEEARFRLHAASFMLHLPENRRGTGFFVTPDLALTAEHNLRPARSTTQFEAIYQGHAITLQWLPDWSSPEDDIAMMRLTENPEEAQIKPLTAVYLDPDLPLSARQVAWAGRPVAVAGYPVRDNCQETELIVGSIYADMAIVTSHENDGVRDRQVERLRLTGSRVTKLGGISGAAILDREWGYVIGITGSYVQELKEVRGSEIAQLLTVVPELAQADIFQKLFAPLPAQTHGVAALSGAPIPAVLPIKVNLLPGDTPAAQLGPKDQALLTQAQRAMQWVHRYMRRFQGRLGQIFAERYGASHTLFNQALFTLQPGPHHSLAQIEAAMTIAYLAQIVQDILIYDLDLACVFPRARLVCAAGFADSSLVPVHNLVPGIQMAQFQGPVWVLYHRPQMSELQVNWAPPPGTQLSPVEQPEELAQTLLAMLETDLKAAGVDQQLAQQLTAELDELHHLETRLHEARQAGQSQESRHALLWQEIELRQKQLDYLEQQAHMMRRQIGQGQQTPPLSQLLEELSDMETACESLPPADVPPDVDKPGAPIIFYPPAEGDDPAVCRRLYRRLAFHYHPDRGQEQSDQFLRLVAHREDRLWLEALDGANEPLRVDNDRSQATDDRHAVEETVDLLLDRLFALRAVRQGLRHRQQSLQGEIAAIGPWQEYAQDSLKTLQEMLVGLKYQINLTWSEANRLASLGLPVYAEGDANDDE